MDFPLLGGMENMNQVTYEKNNHSQKEKSKPGPD